MSTFPSKFSFMNTEVSWDSRVGDWKNIIIPLYDLHHSQTFHFILVLQCR